MFVLAHLSDPHLGPLPRPRLSELAGKRGLGYLNWWRGRRGHHRGDVLAKVLQDLHGSGADHIAVTGDLVNIALAKEFAPARLFLESLGPPEKVTFVPGNHDIYVRATAGHHDEHWGAYMRDDVAPDAPTRERGPFPFVRRRGPVALIGLSSALPTGLFMATGRLGAEQAMMLANMLDALREEGLFRIVLIHHPPVSRHRRRMKRLLDAASFIEVMKRYGAELVLHGHDHVHSLVWLDGPERPVPVLGVPSASAALHGRGDPAGYNLYRIEGGARDWSCELVSRGVRLGAQTLVETSRQRLR